ncbi:MAG: bactofilin family protein [Nitrososphaeraceae archaeon]
MDNYDYNKNLGETKTEINKPLENKLGIKNLLIINGTSAKINGTIDISGDVDISCEIAGDLKAEGKVIIQKDAKLSCGVTAKEVEIIGQYKGDMTAKGKVTVVKGGILNGNIVTDNIVINEGGIFSGTVKRTETADNENTPFKKFHLEDENTLSDESTASKALKDLKYKY